MSQPDDIEKLLREIDAMNAGTTGGVPAKPEEKAVEPAASTESGGGGRLAWTGASAVGGLFVGGFTGTVLMFLPYVGPVSTAVGAAVGAAAAAAVSGPPRWFNKD